MPSLGLLTTAITASTDAAAVQRTWGLLGTLAGARREQFYGPRFAFREYMRARNWLTGLALRVGAALLGLLVLASPRWVRRLVARSVYQPGEGPEAEAAERDEIEYRGVATADDPEGGGDGDGEQKKAFCRAWFRGSTYLCEWCPGSLFGTFFSLMGRASVWLT